MSYGEPIDDSRTARDRVIDSKAVRVAEADGDDWGFCYVCAFEVPVGSDGLLVRHRRGNHAYEPADCGGSGREPTPQPAPECQPVKLVDLRKSALHLRLRQQRRDERIRAKAKAEREAREREAQGEPALEV